MTPAGMVRASSINYINNQAANTPTELIAENQYRVAITFLPPLTAGQYYTLQLAPWQTLGNSGPEIFITDRNSPMLLDIETYGNIVQKRWIYSAGSGVIIQWIETVIAPALGGRSPVP